MKKVLVVTLAVLLVVALTACSSTPGTSASGSAAPASSAATAGGSAAAPAPSSGDQLQTTASSANNVGAKAKKDLTFVMVPKTVHEWFDAVCYGADQEAAALSKQLGINIKIDYRAPSTADVTTQNSVLEQAAATNPDGIILDPNDYNGSKQVIQEIQQKGITVMLFDARVPGSGLCAIGNDFTEQATLEANDLANRLNKKGKVAIMAGVPTAANHAERYEALKKALAQYPDIKVIEAGPDQDNYQTAQQLASACIAANPDLGGFLCVDASGPIGISAAIEEAGKQGKITFVGAENLLQILQYIKDGTMCCSYSTKPQDQGALAVLNLYQAYIGMDIPQFVDTGILYIDKNNVDQWISIAQASKNTNASASPASSASTAAVPSAS